MRAHIAIYVSGLIFALGLGVSGMTDANKVLGFLDLAGGWDPSLAFVMVGAIAVHVMLRPLILGRGAPIFGESFSLPTRTDIDARLIGGAALFGLGWGLGGYCPGPAIVSGVTLDAEVMVFLGAMVLGMVGFHAVTPPEPQVEE